MHLVMLQDTPLESVLYEMLQGTIVMRHGGVDVVEAFTGIQVRSRISSVPHRFGKALGGSCL